MANIKIVGSRDEIDQYTQIIRVELDRHGIGHQVGEPEELAERPETVRVTLITNLADSVTTTSTGGYTCPFSRCRAPFGTYVDLYGHMALMQDPLNHSHNVDLFTEQDLVAEVRHMVACGLRLEESCGYYKAVANSYVQAVRRACRPVRAGGVCEPKGV